MFHAQAIDLERNTGDGTFFTNLCREPMFTALRTRVGIASTDLSTARVDKRESPFASGSCVIYVKQLATMTRNCIAGRECPTTGLHRPVAQAAIRV
jgi:hypothetical protein